MVEFKTPLPLFDTIENLEHQSQWEFADNPDYYEHNFKWSRSFLLSYKGSSATYNTYRREIERLLQWSWHIAQKSVTTLRRTDIESYLEFCQKPPESWIGLQKTPRFILKNAQRIPNSRWRPFVVRLTKMEIRQGMEPSIKNYQLSESAMKDIFAILSSYYNFLIQEDITEINPIAQIRQKSKYFKKRHGKSKIRRLSELQWQYVIETTEQLANQYPEKHERGLFILSALYLMYLRISELAARDSWTPTMNDFSCDYDGLWWFTVLGKGNKERDIAVSDSMLDALKRWRCFLKLSPLPSPADKTPLLPKRKGFGGIANTSFIRKIVQFYFDASMERLKLDGLNEDAAILGEATVHWLRHTGISDDVKVRPREHVRDDAGHGSGAITDKYIDIERRERHTSARKKILKISIDEE